MKVHILIDSYCMANFHEMNSGLGVVNIYLLKATNYEMQYNLCW